MPTGSPKYKKVEDFGVVVKRVQVADLERSTADDIVDIPSVMVEHSSFFKLFCQLIIRNLEDS